MPSLIIEGVIACLLTMPPTASDMDNYLNCREQYRKVEVVQQWIPILQTHFEQEDVLQASLMIYCESSGRPKAVNTNTNSQWTKVCLCLMIKLGLGCKTNLTLQEIGKTQS